MKRDAGTIQDSRTKEPRPPNAHGYHLFLVTPSPVTAEFYAPLSRSDPSRAGKGSLWNGTTAIVTELSHTPPKKCDRFKERDQRRL